MKGRYMTPMPSVFKSEIVYRETSCCHLNCGVKAAPADMLGEYNSLMARYNETGRRRRDRHVFF